MTYNLKWLVCNDYNIYIKKFSCISFYINSNSQLFDTIKINTFQISSPQQEIQIYNTQATTKQKQKTYPSVNTNKHNKGI